MTFEQALGLLKTKNRVARAGWNGKGMWLELVRADKLPWIGMKTADGGFVPWLASQTDLLADDWEIVHA